MEKQQPVLAELRERELRELRAFSRPAACPVCSAPIGGDCFVPGKYTSSCGCRWEDGELRRACSGGHLSCASVDELRRNQGARMDATHPDAAGRGRILHSARVIAAAAVARS